MKLKFTGFAPERFVPKALTGRPEEMERRLEAAFGNGEFREGIDAVRRRNAAYWFICAGLALLLITSIAQQAVQGGAQAIESVERPTYPAEPVRVSAEVEAEYEGESVRRHVELTVRPKGIDDEERRERVEDTVRRLPGLILGKNESLSNIASDLNLIEFDEETGVAISWASDNPALAGDDGSLNRVIGQVGAGFNLKARLTLENISEVTEINCTLGPAASEEDTAADMTAVLKGTVAELNASTEGETLLLPGSDTHGLRYIWREGAPDIHIPEMFAIAMFVVFLYRSRYNWIDKRIKEARKSIIRDFPEFIDKLLLMLNAGLVVSEALPRIASD
jgi:hypothetical protein